MDLSFYVIGLLAWVISGTPWPVFALFTGLFILHMAIYALWVYTENPIIPMVIGIIGFGVLIYNIRMLVLFFTSNGGGLFGPDRMLSNLVSLILLFCYSGTMSSFGNCKNNHNRGRTK